MSSRRQTAPRKAKANVTYSPGYDPEAAADDPHTRRIQTLNKEAFPHKDFALIDDFVLACFLGSKTQPQRWAALHPDRASTSKYSLMKLGEIDLETLTKICKECVALTHPSLSDDLSSTVEQCIEVIESYSIFEGTPVNWKAIARQYVAPRNT